MEQSGRKPLELYLHIPFCASKCKYCDFRSAPASGAARQAYVKDLCRKIRSHGDLAEVSLVVSIFLGGGTPSILEAEMCSPYPPSGFRNWIMMTFSPHPTALKASPRAQVVLPLPFPV